jgi:hypothetical protein
MPITHSKITSRVPITHTPGPWHVQGRYIVPADDGPSIGSAIALKAPSLKAQPDYDAVAQVNARMMAAAPDMVELLYRCLPFIEDANEDPCYKPDRVAALENQIRTLLDSLERPL